MAENKVAPDLSVPEVAPAPEPTTAAADETAAPIATTTTATEPAAAKPAEPVAPKKQKTSPMDIVKKLLAKFKKEKKAQPVAA
ncbi:uncharacterized protein RCC_09357 [Ramularia collo-cygni]|uniref:Uncharacterized protein n=1 Tax=Ramularia collo-cygni TaxID=112498 RepID=A0A2D3V6N9_9PEZI|nr:uncharacterized protein RCC_09357 [Ramularia collo-cygni]CZT23643.1 uncharacterized protein RCC_09357 [Ramularia collo-cygni]